MMRADEVLSSWPRLADEHGVLEEVILCPPVAALAEHPTLGVRDLVEARRQYAALRESLPAHGVRWRELPDDPSLPMQCYTRDAGIHTPWGLVMARMELPQRRREPYALAAFARADDVEVIDLSFDAPLEGGDVLLLRAGLVAIGCNGRRTHLRSAQRLQAFFHAQGWEARIFRYGEEHVHLDVLLGVAGADLLVSATELLARDDVDWLRRSGFEILRAPLDEVPRLGCNVVALGEGRVLATAQAVETNAALRRRGLDVVALDLAAFVADGGGTHCVTLPWRRRAAAAEVGGRHDAVAAVSNCSLGEPHA